MAKTIGSFDLASLKNLRDDVTQYFWFESNSSSAWGSGAHVTLYPESQFTDSTNPNYMKGQNIIMNTDGFSIRNGGLPMMVLDNDSLDFNAVDTTQGTYVTMATFGLNGAQIGQTGESHLEMDYHSMQLMDRKGNPYFYVSDLRDKDGNVYIEDTIESTGQLRSYRLSHICDTTKQISVYVNGSLVSDENYSIGFNQMLQTSRVDFTYTPQIGTIIVEYYAIGQNAKALTFGIRNGEVGAMSVGLGYNVVADGTYSFAEGQESVASGATSHAEGWGTLAGSICCHAEGNHTKALGVSSHASGYFTQANYGQQFVCGAYNDNKSGNAFEIGNGTADDARSNALTVDWSGNVVASGSIISDTDYDNAWNHSDKGYTVMVSSLAGSTYLGQAIRLEKVSSTNKHPIFNGFDISGTGTARIHTLGHYIYQSTYNNESYWTAYIKMRNDNTSAITNFNVTAYIAWI